MDNNEPRLFTTNELYSKYLIKRIKKVNPDGNCQFRALADQIYGSQKYYEVVKDRIIDSIERSNEFYISTFDNNIDKYNEWLSNLKNAPKGIDTWGTIETLRAACIYYNRPIVVHDKMTHLVHLYDPNLLRLTTEKEYTGYNSDEIVLIFSGDNHYDSVTYKEL